MPKRVPHVTHIHGQTLTDDYFWMRDRSDPDVLAHLEAENAATAAAMSATQPLQAALYREMLGRIKQTDLSVPSRIGDYLYYSRTEEGRQYPCMCRRRGSMQGDEELLLDLNTLAEGHSFLELGAFVVSDDAETLAYSLDTTGYRQFTLQIKSLRDGSPIGSPIDRVTGVVWAADNRTLFYTTEHEVSKRSYRCWRHDVPSGASDLVHEEEDELYDVGVMRSLDRKVIFLGSFAKTSSEQRFLRAVGPDRSVHDRGAACRRARVRRRSLRRTPLHPHQPGLPQLPRGDRAARRSVRAAVAAVHRPRSGGEDRGNAVLREARRDRGARERPDLPARHRHEDEGVAPDRHGRIGLRPGAREQHRIRHRHRPLLLSVDGDAAVRVRLPHGHERAHAAQAAGGPGRVRPVAVRGAPRLGRGS